MKELTPCLEVENERQTDVFGTVLKIKMNDS
jgi:hypothetical protein